MTIKEAQMLSTIYKNLLSNDIACIMIDKMIKSEVKGY